MTETTIWTLKLSRSEYGSYKCLCSNNIYNLINFWMFLHACDHFTAMRTNFVDCVGLQRRPSGWLPDPNWWNGPKPQWLRPQLEHRPWVRHYTRHMLLQLKDVSLLIHIIDDSPLILPSGVTSQRLAHPQGVQMLSRSCMKGLLTVVSYWTAMAHLLLAIQKSTPMWVKSKS